MRKRIDLTGQRFGNLVVVSRTERKGGYWLCKCDCGNTKEVSLHNLRAGHTKSCGCLKVPRAELTGQRFGKLTVLGYEGRTKQGQSKWRCICDCGKETVKAIGNLKRGSPSCSRTCSKQKTKPGDRFGKLTVVARDGNYDLPSGKMPRYLCKCDCGREVHLDRARLMGDKNNSCGCDNLIVRPGQRFGKVVAKDWEQDSFGITQWDCVCDCGTELRVPQHNLWYGAVVSCGCDKSLADANTPGTLLYVLEANQRVKIGITRSFMKRVSTLQTSCPVRISVVRLFKDADTVKEKEIHKILSSIRTRGEWFIAEDILMNIAWFSSDIDDFIANIRQQYGDKV